MKTLSPNAINVACIGEQNVVLGWNGVTDPVSTTDIVSLGTLPPNCVVKAALGTVIEAEGGAGNLLLCYRTVGGGASTTTLLTVDANGAAGTLTAAPATYLGTTATTQTSALLNTGTVATYELCVKGSAALDAAKVVLNLVAFFGPTAGTDGTGNLFL